MGLRLVFVNNNPEKIRPNFLFLEEPHTHTLTQSPTFIFSSAQWPGLKSVTGSLVVAAFPVASPGLVASSKSACSYFARGPSNDRRLPRYFDLHIKGWRCEEWLGGVVSCGEGSKQSFP